MARPTNQGAIRPLPRRAILKGLAMAPVLFRPAPFFGESFSLRAAEFPATNPALPFPALPFSDTRFVPLYPARSPLSYVIGLVAPGSDEYTSEKYAVEIEEIFMPWGSKLNECPHHFQNVEI